MMYWNVVSFESRLSERKKPSSSEESLERFQNSWSVSFAGSDAADARPEGTRKSPPKAPTIEQRAMMTIHCRAGSLFGFMAGNTSTRTRVLGLAKLIYSPIDFGKRGADLTFSFFVIGGFE